MALVPRTPPPPRRLVLGPRWRIACTALQFVPVPGVGAIIAGWRNPQSDLLVHGILQTLLVVSGAWPLVWPAVIGIAWAAWDAWRIHQARPPGALSLPVEVDGAHGPATRRSRTARRR